MPESSMCSRSRAAHGVTGGSERGIFKVGRRGGDRRPQADAKPVATGEMFRSPGPSEAGDNIGVLSRPHANKSSAARSWRPASITRTPSSSAGLVLTKEEAAAHAVPFANYPAAILCSAHRR